MRSSSLPLVSDRPSRGFYWLGGALLAVLLWTYGPLAAHPFVRLDDLDRISDNPDVLNGVSWNSLLWAFSSGANAVYPQPLTWLSFQVDASLFGASPAGVHFESALLHAAAALLLLLLLLRLGGSTSRSLLATALFALHPLQVEAVAWASERNTVLAAILAIGAVHGYVSYARRPSVPRAAAVMALFAGSLLAKPWLVTLPLVMLVLDAWPLGRFRSGAASPRPGRVVLEKGALLTIPFALAFFAAPLGGDVQVASRVPLPIRVAHAPVAVVRTLAHAVFPTDLSIVYPYPTDVPLWQSGGALLLLGLVTAFAILTRRRAPSLLAGWTSFLLLLAPTVGIVQSGRWPALADRFSYVALAPLAASLAFAIPSPSSRRIRRSIAALTFAVCLLLAALSRTQLSYWTSSITLLRHATRVAPADAMLHAFVGDELVLAGLPQEAEQHFVAACAEPSDPYCGLAHNTRGRLYERIGLVEAATREYQSAWELTHRPGFLFNEAVSLANAGRDQEALRAFRLFLDVTVGDPNRSIADLRPLAHAAMEQLAGKAPSRR